MCDTDLILKLMLILCHVPDGKEPLACADINLINEKTELHDHKLHQNVLCYKYHGRICFHTIICYLCYVFSQKIGCSSE